MVIWIIGMSASGKTTIGKKIYEKLKYSKEKWIFLDGDIFRNILGEDLGHTIEDRKKNAYRISKFCEFLNLQNINVIASVLSIFHDNQKYNKENIPDYKEIFLNVKFDNLLKRDNKELYKKALDGKIKNVVGVDIKFIPPFSPDLIIDNNYENPDYQKLAQKIIDDLNINIDNSYIYTEKNLLNFPNTYQYSKYQGKDFFELYKRNRKKKLDFLKIRLDKLNSKRNYSFELKNNDNYKNDKELNLKEYLIYLYNLNNNELKNQKKTIEILIKRFEVSKKLFTIYDLKNIKKLSSKFDELIIYPLFSLVLQKYYSRANNQQKLLFLNTILKINDIISSIASDLIFKEEVYYSIEAIKGELKIMGEYI
jgi:adenylylsulfate kinase-like enzyme